MAPKKAKKAAPKSSGSVVRIDPPSMALLPGRTVTFYTDPPEGVAEVKVTTERGVKIGKPSVTSTGASVSHIVETGEETIEVSFYDDGKEYASEKFTV